MSHESRLPQGESGRARTSLTSAALNDGAEPERLSAGQVTALLAAVGRELTFGLPLTALALRRWRQHAQGIPDPALRAAACDALLHKRGYADGAALFTIVPARRSRALLRSLISYELIIDYLDNVHEASPGEANGRQLHLALVDAVDLRCPPRQGSDYYRYHPVSDDSGYLSALVAACRAGCSRLPSYRAVMPLLVREARRASVLAINHEPDPQRRDAGLRAWATAEHPTGVEDLAWWEITGAASSSLLTHALLTLAADRQVDAMRIDAVCRAMWPWIDLATTMLDSFVDWEADRASGSHAYLDHYVTPDHAIERVQVSVALASRNVLLAPRGRRHAVIVAAMIALYLSAPSACTGALAPAARAIAAEAGALSRLLVPVLATWRRLNRQEA